PNYIPADFKDVDAVVPAMGNHLIDLTGAEFNKQPFTRSWIYGVYDGKVIFYEEMVTRAHLLSKPNTCTPIKSPKAVATRGYYPTVSCIRHNPATGEHTISMRVSSCAKRARRIWRLPRSNENYSKPLARCGMNVITRTEAVRFCPGV